MARKVTGNTGFDDFINNPDGSGMRKSADLGVSGGKWPTAEAMKKVAAGSADVAHTSLQALDPAYFDPLLFWVQHRDRKELNFRLRYYSQYHPYVGNILDMHSSFPLSDYRLQCMDNSIQRSYEDMSDRIELLNLLRYTLKDFHMLGEAFPYGRWSDTDKTWDYFTLFPPEKMELKSTYVTPNPIIILQVDEQLKRVVNSGDEIDQRITQMMDPAIVDKIKTTNYIPIPSWQISHFSNKISMTDLRGSSLLLRVLKDLIQEDQLRLLHFTVTQRSTFPLKIFKLGNSQTGWIPNRSHFENLRQQLIQAAGDPDFCFSEDTQLLTENGWKFFKEIDPKENIATFNPKTEQLEYQVPTHWTSYKHTGEMLNFKTNSIDMMVTPDHWMWVQPMDKPKTGEYPWRFMKAKDVPGSYRMRATTKFSGSLNVESYGGPKVTKKDGEYFADINGLEIELKTLMRLLGFYISEGGAWVSKIHTNKSHRVQFSQLTANVDFVSTFREMITRLPFEVFEGSRVTKKQKINGYDYGGGKPYIVFGIYDQRITRYLMDKCGDHSYTKKVPTWVKMLPPDYIKVLLDSMIMGDGTLNRRHGVTNYSYYTTSPKLVDDVQESALKVGWASTWSKHSPTGITKVPHYQMKLVPPDERKAPRLFYPIIKTRDKIKTVQYDGMVFCPTVLPHHLVFARRGGRICITGQCLIYHHGLQVEYIGAHDKVANLIPEFEFCQKRILAGLFANDALVSGSTATYANANVSVRILMHRYLNIRNQLETMVNNKIFLPVAKARGYYVPDKTGNSGKMSVNVNGKYKILDLPKMRWMKLNLIDDTSQKNFIMRLLDKNVVPHKLIAEIFDLEENDLLHQLKQQQGTVVDPVYNKAREAAAADEEIRKQVLDGKKTDEWKFPEKKSDEKKKPKAPRENLKSEVNTPQPAPEEAGGEEVPEAPAGGPAPVGPAPATPAPK